MDKKGGVVRNKQFETNLVMLWIDYVMEIKSNNSNYSDADFTFDAFMTWVKNRLFSELPSNNNPSQNTTNERK